MIATINRSYAYLSFLGLLWDVSHCLYALIGLVTISFIRFTCSFGQRSCDARKQQDIIILLITCAKYIFLHTPFDFKPQYCLLLSMIVIL